jgi:hypothetical protein
MMLKELYLKPSLMISFYQFTFPLMETLLQFIFMGLSSLESKPF